MRRKSIWEGKSPDVSDFPQLVGNNESDIIIIGGGITGLTTALLLYEKGYSVSLLEAGKIAGGTTGLSSCHLNTDIDEEYRNITENFDLETAAAVAESRRSAIDFIEKITIEKNISCDFKRVPGYLYSEIPEDVTIIKEEFAYASKAGLDVSLHDSAPLPFPTKKALRFENQAEFNSVKYLQGLASYIKGKVNIYENSQVVDMHEENGHYFLKTAEGMIKASRVVMATHLPLFFNLIQTISAPYISYMIAARLNSTEYAEGLFWDTAEPYHYTRYYKTNEGVYVVVGGEDHKTGHERNAGRRIAELENYVRKRFDVSSIDYKWSAQYYEPADGLPYIGKSAFAENVFIATGFSGDGLVYGTIAGMIISDIISGKENEWHKIYDSTRFTPAASAADFVKENADVAKRFIKDRLKAEDEDFSDLRPGEGRVVRMDGEPVAVMRDEKNNFRIVSAVCPHMKCLVNWNNFEQTWDCPCHGSRFDNNGKVIYGPAAKGLEKKVEERVKRS